MSAHHLISSALQKSGEVRPLPEVPEIGKCCVTGIIGPTIARHHVVQDSFTNQELFLAQESDRVSTACWDSFGHKWQRMASWYCDGNEFRRLTRVDVRDLVIGGVTAENWAGYATTSFKKHGAVGTPVNQSGQAIWRFETLLVDCSATQIVQETWERLRWMRVNGFSVKSLANFQPTPWSIGTCGVAQWIDFSQWAKPRWRSPLYQFLCYLLPSHAEIENYEICLSTISQNTLLILTHWRVMILRQAGSRLYSLR